MARIDEITRQSSKAERASALRSLASQVAWLDAPMYWDGTRLGWRSRNGDVFPDASTLSKAQRKLNKIAQFTQAAPSELGEDWLATKFLQLEFVKLASRLTCIDLKGTTARALKGDPSAANELLRLLPCEALAVNCIEPSPARSLVRAMNNHSLQIALANCPLIAHPRVDALIGLIEGALGNQHDPKPAVKQSEGSPHTKWTKRARSLARQSGVPEYPSLYVTLLSSDDGIYLSTRVSSLAGKNSSARALLENLNYALLTRTQTISPDSAVSALDELIASAPLIERLRALDAATRKRRAGATTSKQTQRSMDKIAELPLDERCSEILTTVCKSTWCGAAVVSARTFVEKLLELGDGTPLLARTALRWLRYFETFTADRASLYLEQLLVVAGKYSPFIAPQDCPANDLSRRLNNWLTNGLDYELSGVHRICHQSLDRATIAECVGRRLHSSIADDDWKDEQVQALLRLARLSSIDLPRSLICLFQSLAKRAKSGAYAFSLLQPLVVHITKKAAQTDALHLLDVLSDALSQRKKTIARDIPRILASLDVLLASGKIHNTCLCHTVVAALLDQADDVPLASLEEALTWTLRELAGRDAVIEFGTAQSMKLAVQIAVAGFDGDVHLFKRLVRKGLSREDNYWANREAVASVAKFNRGVARDLARLYASSPNKALKLFDQVATMQKLSRDSLGYGGYNETGPAQEESTSFQATHQLPSDWAGALLLLPQLAADIRACFDAARVAGKCEVPTKLREVVSQDYRLRREYEYLLQRKAQGCTSASMQKRINSLEQLLLRKPHERTDLQKLRNWLKERACKIRLMTLERAMHDFYVRRLATIVDTVPENIQLTDDLMNAVILSTSTDNNRGLLKRILREHFAGNTSWREQQPANKRFLEEMRKAGLNVEVWLGRHDRIVPCSAVPQGYLRIYMEDNPLRILQMGNLFGTCLSVGDINSFSAIANACDLNKRVIYAVDNSGAILGRKLIAVSDKLSLLGYYTYGRGSTKAQNEAIAKSINEYATRIADCCGMQLSADGTVRKLLSNDWYDDGSVDWENQHLIEERHSRKAHQERAHADLRQSGSVETR